MNSQYTRLTKPGTFSRKVIDYFRFMHLAFANHIVSHIPSYFIRKIIYRYLYLMKIGKKTNIQMGLRVYAPWKIKIGDNCSIGFNTLLDGRRGIKIGNNVDLSGQNKILTLGHNLDDPLYSTNGRRVIIKDNVSVFSGATILPGRILGEGSVVSADTLLVTNTKPWCIYAGNPSEFIRKRNISELRYRRNYKRYFH